MIQPSFDGSKIACFGGHPATPVKEFWKVGQVMTVGEIVDHKGRKVDSLVLEPQGIAHLVSEEEVRLPLDVCALAHVLTRKCNQGLLTLNIGVVDPGWSGKISTSILNFSAERRLLSKGDKFIRLTFHRVSMEERSEYVRDNRSLNFEDSSYQREVCSRAVDNFGKYFLNIDQLVGRASEKENARLRDAFLKYLPIAAFSLAFFALLVTVGGAVVTRVLSAADHSSQGQPPVDMAEMRRLEAKVSALEGLLKSQSARSTPATIGSSPKADPRSRE
ncbi:dCTP deaminase domain-containing protein [Frateuria hangzhouensis]|uniref:dCTP deaminase domain-containing protein n=1 Tax=Frateuria hangzhouensis TaxID=2995589 RepID=UPI002260F4ED|nr:hypothetical protein [Frateuria sp. STR12]MCX7513447.1 hypothetical protein [Frateuria sp. STR12]